MIAERMKMIDASGIRKVFDLAKNMKDPVNLSIGQPDFDIPEVLKEEAIAAIRDGFNRYTVTQGIDELRAGIGGALKEKKVQFEDTLVTSGVSGGLLLAFMTVINPGDEVIVPDPYFVMYKHLVNLVGGVPVFCDTYPDFRMDAGKIAALITPKTKIILVNSPSNPTGAVSDERTMREIAALAREKGLLVISDEIYDSFSYDGPCPSFGAFYDRTLTLNGFSKSLSMTGWRIGYAAGPKEIIKEMTKLQQYTFVCAPSFAQLAAVKGLDVPMEGYIAEYRGKRDLIYEGLKNEFRIVKPEGAFYMFPEAPNGAASEFVRMAIERNLLIIPGNVFSQRDTHFRISYAASSDTIKKGIDILNELARTVKQK
ncbi:MAG TPA: pyridoxal phosphate-dependent aminotransferase [bacterium]|nr:pyridoxal phosphate-dependent aminotransferase [bacterium]